MEKRATIIHLVSYQQSHVVGYDVEIQGELHFYTTEAMKLALLREDFVLDKEEFPLWRDFPQRTLLEEEYQKHPTLSNLEKIELLQGALIGRRYVYHENEEGEYVATMYHGKMPCFHQPLPFYNGKPVLSLVGIFDEPEDCHLPSSPPQMELTLLAVEKEGVRSPVSIKSKKIEIPPRAWEKSQDLCEISLLPPLSHIGERAFSDCPKLKELSLPETLVHVEEEAFSGTSLRTVTLPNKLQTLGGWAFSYCQQLEEITLPDKLKLIDKCTFISCVNLKQILLPKKLEEIGAKAFYACGLEELILPEGVREIGAEAFAYCKNLKRVQFPHSLEKIHSSAFAHCGVEEIILKEGLISIGTSVFSHCTQLKQVFIPSSVHILGNSAFQDCIQLKKVEFTPCYTSLPRISCLGASAFSDSGLIEINLPDTIEVIENKAFYGCKQLWTISLPSELRELGDYAFAESGLLRISLPNTLNIIGEEVFLDCSSLRVVDSSTENL